MGRARARSGQIHLVGSIGLGLSRRLCRAQAFAVRQGIIAVRKRLCRAQRSLCRAAKPLPCGRPLSRALTHGKHFFFTILIMNNIK